MVKSWIPRARRGQRLRGGRRCGWGKAYVRWYKSASSDHAEAAGGPAPSLRSTPDKGCEENQDTTPPNPAQDTRSNGWIQPRDCGSAAPASSRATLPGAAARAEALRDAVVRRLFTAPVLPRFPPLPRPVLSVRLPARDPHSLPRHGPVRRGLYRAFEVLDRLCFGLDQSRAGFRLLTKSFHFEATRAAAGSTALMADFFLDFGSIFAFGPGAEKPDFRIRVSKSKRMIFVW